MNDEAMDLRSKVATAILTNPEIGQAFLEIDEQDGCITLNGNCATEQDRMLAEVIASRQDGVVKVINNIICE